MGSVTVAIDRVALGAIKMERLNNSTFEMEGPLLQIAIQVSTSDATKKFDYSNWNDRGAISDHTSVLKDNFGNEYHSRRYTTFPRPVGHILFATLTSEKPVADVLVFEPPLKTSEVLTLELDARTARFGEGKFRFRIPRSAWAPE